MKRKIIIFFVSCVIFISIGFSYDTDVFQLCPTLKKSIEWEFYANESNDPLLRGEPHFKVQHYDVPVKLLGPILVNEVNNLPSIYNSLLFYKTWNGKTEQYVRWIINPEDTKFHKVVSTLLKQKGYDSTPQYYFLGHLTSSRSIYLEDPITHFVFSVKVSTNKTGGKWTNDKKVDQTQVVDSYNFSKQALMVEKKHEFKNLHLLKEPFMTYLDDSIFIDGEWVEVDQGLIVRDLGPMIDCKHYYLPGFSALHENVGASISAINSVDPSYFWSEYYAKNLGLALGEFSAFLGMGMTSAHSQQFLIQLDEDFKPTGKIIIRDFNDSQLIKGFYAGSSHLDVLDFFDYCSETFNGRYVKSYHKVFFGILHGSARPSWLSKAYYRKSYVENFMEAYESKFSSLTGVSREELLKGRPHYPKNVKNYFSKKYTISKKKNVDEGWKKYFSYSDCFLGAVDFIDEVSCQDILQKLQLNSEF